MVCMLKNGKNYPAYVLKYNQSLEKETIPLMVSNREKQWNYLSVNKLRIIKKNNF